MSQINRYDSNDSCEIADDGPYVLHSDHEAEVARLRAELQNAAKAALDAVALSCEKEREADALRAEVEGLRDALAPFAEFALVRTAAGKTSPKTGAVYSVHTRLGEAEITAEHFEAAFNAIGASA